MSNYSLIFFPRDEPSDKGFLGSGYLTSGVIKVDISVFQSRKHDDKFNVALPGSYKNSAGDWVNTVEFRNNESRLAIINELEPKIRHLLKDSSGPGPAPPDSPPASDPANAAPTEVDIQSSAGELQAPF